MPRLGVPRCAFLLLCVLAHGCAATRAGPAFPPARALEQWGNVTSVAQRTPVDVVVESGTTHRGRLAGVDDAGLVLETAMGQRIRIERETIREVAVRRGRDSVKNGALIGAAIGVGYAAIVLARIESGGDSVDGAAGGIAVAGLIGAAIGAWVDHARGAGGRVVIYRPNP